MTAPFIVSKAGAKARRARYSEGSVKRVGKRVKKWLGYWYVYVSVNGREVRRKRKKILGPGTMSKQEAKDQLRKHVATDRPGSFAASPDTTVAELWNRYAAYKSASWGKQMAETMGGTFRSSVLPEIGNYPVTGLTIDPLQAVLTKMVRDGRSKSALQKVRTHMKAALEYAVDIDLIGRNPARGKKLVIPRKGIKKPSERFYEIDEVHQLLEHSKGRDHLILKLFLVGGFRPGELFALRLKDIESGQILVDEALKVRETGADLIGDPKTDGSTGYAAITKSIEKELRDWVSCLKDQSENAWLFPSRSRKGSVTPLRPANYLKRILKPLAAAAGIDARETGKLDGENRPILTSGITYQALRRTCGTYYRKDLKSAQAQLRHSSPVTTAKHYMKSISADLRSMVEKIDAEFSKTKVVEIDAQVSPKIRKAGG